jgi:hypothetical protein
MKHLPNEKQKIDVHSHIENGFKIIDDYLPAQYIAKVHKKLPKGFTTDNVIRNVRRKIQKPQAQIEIFTALVEVAKENRAAINKLAEIV